MIELDEIQLNPKVLFANYYIGMNRPKISAIEKRPIYDYEIELVTDVDNGYMIEDDQPIEIQKGDIIFRRPYNSTQGYNRYNSYILTFEARPSNRSFTNYQLEHIKSYSELVKHPLLNHLPHKYHTQNFSKYLQLFREICTTYISEDPGSKLYMRSLLSQLIYTFYKEYMTLSDSNHKKAPLINQVMLYIESNLSEDLSLQVLADRYDYSAIYFHQLFKTITHVTLSQYVTSKRIDKAKELLIHSNETIKAICYEVGYKDPSYFVSVFVKVIGMTPKTYRETYRITYDLS